MNVLRTLGAAAQYLSEGISRLFSPNKDEYPQTGVQPFEGEPYSKWVSGDRK
jgi:hypothetical protein